MRQELEKKGLLSEDALNFIDVCSAEGINSKQEIVTLRTFIAKLLEVRIHEEIVTNHLKSRTSSPSRDDTSSPTSLSEALKQATVLIPGVIDVETDRKSNDTQNTSHDVNENKKEETWMKLNLSECNFISKFIWTHVEPQVYGITKAIAGVYEDYKQKAVNTENSNKKQSIHIPAFCNIVKDILDGFNSNGKELRRNSTFSGNGGAEDEFVVQHLVTELSDAAETAFLDSKNEYHEGLLMRESRKFLTVCRDGTLEVGAFIVILIEELNLKILESDNLFERRPHLSKYVNLKNLVFERRL